MIHDYIECALWSSYDYDSDLNFDQVEAELHPKTIEQMESDLLKFMEAVKELEIENPLSDEQTAHDFWLTRNGHGAGFWDREIGEVGDQLTSLAKSFGEATLYIGGDGFIHQA